MATEIIRFGEFELNPGAFELRHDGSLVRLERIPMDLLIFLVERRGQLVTRDEILARIWGKDVFVDVDNSINTAVRKLRAALKDDPENPRFLFTVPGKGYRFAGELTSGSDVAKQVWWGRWTLWAVFAGVVGVVGVFLGPRYMRPAEGNKPAKMRLVVLPFVNMSGDPNQEYFADGMTEEIITQLGGLDPDRLGVIARTSSMKYKGTREDANQIAKELGADYLLEGSVRREGEKVRIAAQLIQASDQTHVWAGNFEENEKEILKLESDLALAVSSKIALTLSPPVRGRLSETPAVKAKAYQAYLSGRQAWGTRTKSGAIRSIAEYQRAIALEPNYAPPYAGLATVYSLASVVGPMSPQEAMPKAKEAALTAIRLDDSLAAGHTALGFVMAHYEFDWAGAEREFRRGIELNSNDANAHFFFSNSYLSPMGRHEEAIAEMKRAIELDPFSASLQSFLGQTLFWAGKNDEAMRQFRKCAEMFPGFAIDHERIAHLSAYMGDYEEAIAEDTRAKIFAGQKTEIAMAQDAALREALEEQGPSGYWKKLLEFSQLPDNPPEAYVTPQQLAIIYAHLGKREKSLSLLEKAYEVRTLGLTELAIEPSFKPLHSEPQFQDLARRLGLPPYAK